MKTNCMNVMGEETSTIPTLLPWFLPERYHLLMIWKSTSVSVRKKGNTGKTARSSLTIPDVMMEVTIPIVCKFYKSLKSIIINYRQGGHCLTVFVLSFVKTDKPWKPVYSEDIIGTKELKNIAHTIVALCPCRKGGEYRFLKVVKSRSGEKNEEVPVLKISKEGGLFFHYVGRMNEKDALPLPVKSRRTPVTFPDLKKDMSEVTGTSVAPLESVLSCEKPETVEEVTDSAVKQDKRIKVTLGKLQQIQELDADGLTQESIAKALGLCRKTVNKYLQCIKREEPQCNLSPLSC